MAWRDEPEENRDTVIDGNKSKNSCNTIMPFPEEKLQIIRASKTLSPQSYGVFYHFFVWLFGSSILQYETEPQQRPLEDLVEYKLESLDKIRLLGSGGYGSVTAVKCKKTGQTLALKAISADTIIEHKLEHSLTVEKKVMQACDSHFLVKLAATFWRDQHAYFLMEVALGGDLYTIYRRSQICGHEDHARFYAACVVCAFEHLHSKKIIYRDLKPENLVMDLQGYCKLCDFGLCTFGETKAHASCGTPDYMAPEMMHNSSHNRAVDWWALGVLIFELLMGRTPFTADNTEEVFARAQAGIDTVQFPAECVWPDLVRALCRHRPQVRLAMLYGDVQNVKEHEWFTKASFNWVSFEQREMKPPYSPTEADSSDMCDSSSQKHQRSNKCAVPEQDVLANRLWGAAFEDTIGPRSVYNI